MHFWRTFKNGDPDFVKNLLKHTCQLIATFQILNPSLLRRSTICCSAGGSVVPPAAVVVALAAVVVAVVTVDLKEK